MVLLDTTQREVSIKLVYYGPALSGKTTNLQRLHQLAAAQSRGRLMSLDTTADRTLFFDLLPLHFRAADVSVKLKVYTVPGQVVHNATRKIVLQGVDGVAFVADSQVAEMHANEDAFGHLKQNLRDNGIDPDDIPIVIQFNKRDLPDGRLALMDDIKHTFKLERGRAAIFAASAIRDEGVLPTFFALCKATWEQLDRRHDLTGRFGVSQADFLRQLGALFGKKL